MLLLVEMSWKQTQEYLDHDDRIILPLGATEQHGPHLGLGTDCIEAEAIARGTGERSFVVIAPTLNYGMMQMQLAFPGTVSLRPTTMIAVLEDVFRSIYRHGFRRVLVVNGHGGNAAAFANALHLVAEETPELRVKSFEWWTDTESYRVLAEALATSQQGFTCFDRRDSLLARRASASRPTPTIARPGGAALSAARIHHCQDVCRETA